MSESLGCPEHGGHLSVPIKTATREKGAVLVVTYACLKCHYDSATRTEWQIEMRGVR